MTTWFTADLHLNHSRILEFCPKTRPFASVEAMNEAIVARWNAKVRPQDTIYFLGDFGFGKEPEQFFPRLNGKRHLIRGNHDYGRKAVLAMPWESVHDLYTVKENGLRAVLCHYPLEVWNQAAYGYLHFHGHGHGSGRKIPHRFDVGFDVFPDGPVSFEELAALAAAETYQPSDHHGAD